MAFCAFLGFITARVPLKAASLPPNGFVGGTSAISHLESKGKGDRGKELPPRVAPGPAQDFDALQVSVHYRIEPEGTTQQTKEEE